MVATAHGKDDREVEVDPDESKSYSQQETFFPMWATRVKSSG